MKAQQKQYKIAPSMLAADFSQLGNEINKVISAGADLIHFDVMDNHYVNNLSFGPLVLASLQQHSINAHFDVHLMVQPIEQLLQRFMQLKVHSLSFHVDATDAPIDALKLLQQHNIQAGIAISPSCAAETITPYLDYLDFVLVMLVEPGFGGQSVLANSYAKIQEIHKIITQAKQEISISVDGGVNSENIAQLARCGASTFIAGSAIFHADDYHNIITKMRSTAVESTK